MVKYITNCDNISGFDQPTTTQVTVPATGAINISGFNTGGASTNDRLSAEVALLVNSTKHIVPKFLSQSASGGHEKPVQINQLFYH